MEDWHTNLVILLEVNWKQSMSSKSIYRYYVSILCSCTLLFWHSGDVGEALQKRHERERWYYPSAQNLLKYSAWCTQKCEFLSKWCCLVALSQLQ